MNHHPPMGKYNQFLDDILFVYCLLLYFIVSYDTAFYFFSYMTHSIQLYSFIPGIGSSPRFYPQSTSFNHKSLVFSSTFWIWINIFHKHVLFKSVAIVQNLLPSHKITFPRVSNLIYPTPNSWSVPLLL